MPEEIGGTQVRRISIQNEENCLLRQCDICVVQCGDPGLNTIILYFSALFLSLRVSWYGSCSEEGFGTVFIVQ